MEVSQALKDAENSLRDFIQSSLSDKFGHEWPASSGISAERIVKWNERKIVEQKRQSNGTPDDRLIYFADFYDLKTLLHKNWPNVFSQVFGEWKEMDVFLTILESFRDTDAHRRELLSFQKHLVFGISGQIRSKIVRYRSMNITRTEYFPKFESIKDNYGNIWTPEKEPQINTNVILRPNDNIEFILTASDPEGLPIEYKIHGFTEWSQNSSIEYVVQKKDIAKLATFMVVLRSPREYHAHQNLFDDVVMFFYSILPK
ncbi:MAG: hypothetical protein V4635_10135 [Bacteroidota bacterium]